MTCTLVKVPKASVLVCLQCPLCSKLVHEATTISECLHTFCKDCIYDYLEDEENDCCPICNVNLGGSPLEKLRADHQLDDVKAKLFPIKLRKRKLADNIHEVAPSPLKRKERSLLSLGVGAALLCANPHSLKTKSTSRQQTATREKSTDDEHEERKIKKVKSQKNDAKRDRAEHEGSGKYTQERNTLDKVQPGLIDAKREVASEDVTEKVETKPLQARKVQHSAQYRKGLLLHGSQEQERVTDFCKNPLSKSGSYPAEKSKVSMQGQTFKASNWHGPCSSGCTNPEPCNCDDHNLTVPLMKERKQEYSNQQPSLAQLAEIAAAQVNKHSDPQNPCVPRGRRGRGKTRPNNVVATEIHPSVENITSTSDPVQQNLPPLIKVVTTNEFSLLKSTNSQERLQVCIPRQDKHNAGFWFALQAADNQTGEAALPQVTSRYLRIKDGKLPVSIVKKYLVKKLGLKHENEVEISCRGQPVISHLPLESVRGMWYATMPRSNSMPFSKDALKGHQWGHVHASAAEDYMMVLTYGRQPQPSSQS